MTDQNDGVIDAHVLDYADQIAELARTLQDEHDQLQVKQDRILDQRDHYQTAADELIKERDEWEAVAKQAWADLRAENDALRAGQGRWPEKSGEVLIDGTDYVPWGSLPKYAENHVKALREAHRELKELHMAIMELKPASESTVPRVISVDDLRSGQVIAFWEEGVKPHPYGDVVNIQHVERTTDKIVRITDSLGDDEHFKDEEGLTIVLLEDTRQRDADHALTVKHLASAEGGATISGEVGGQKWSMTKSREAHGNWRGEFPGSAFMFHTSSDVATLLKESASSAVMGRPAEHENSEAEPETADRPRASFGATGYAWVIYSDGSVVENTGVTGGEIRATDLDAAPTWSIVSSPFQGWARVKLRNGEWGRNTTDTSGMSPEALGRLDGLVLRYPASHRADGGDTDSDVESARTLPREPGAVILVTEFDDRALIEPVLASCHGDELWARLDGELWPDYSTVANDEQITAYLTATVTTEDEHDDE